MTELLKAMQEIMEAQTCPLAFQDGYPPSKNAGQDKSKDGWPSG
jgi:hypothetical protein